jgi:hypothetical protein
MAMSKIEESTLISILGKLPPNNLQWSCQSPEHYSAFLGERHVYLDIGRILQAYFFGQKVPQLPSYGGNYQELIEGQANYYLKLYDVLFWGWEAIESSAKARGFELPIQNPGEALLYILIQDSELMFRRHLDRYFEFSPRKFYSQGNELKKLEAEPPSNIRDRKLKAILTDLRRFKSERYRLRDFYDFCIAAIEKCPRKSQANKALRVFNVNNSELEAMLQKKFNPRYRNQGFKIVKGKRHSLTGS